MDGFMEWFLSKLRLIDDDEIEIEEEPSEDSRPYRNGSPIWIGCEIYSSNVGRVGVEYATIYKFFEIGNESKRYTYET